MQENQISLNLSEDYIQKKETIIYKDIIIDRKSKYTVVGTYVTSREDIDNFMKKLIEDEYYRKATHNTYAYRIKLENGSILEGKNDDGETGAGMCILRELQRKNAINILLIVTRYFGGIKLQTDRFKNVINATKMYLEKNS
ncbi:MAG: YigZ family protein [Candidatus Gracilibacteria bacterium]|nr:YigZ family protein [Candidatus Gracilibacteria bacterium]